MSNFENLKNKIVLFMHEAETLSKLNTGEEKKIYTLLKLEKILGDSFETYGPILSIMIDLIISALNKEITIGNKKIKLNCFK